VVTDAADAREQGRKAALDYLCVESFLRTLVDARSLKMAFEIGLVDLLVQGAGHRSQLLKNHWPLDRAGA
jgi:hypothetical protein